VNISRLAERAGVATSTVRFYERSGVLPSAARRRNGYRDYDEADLAQLRLVVTLRRLGVSAPDAGRLAAACVGGAPAQLSNELLETLAAQHDAIARQRAELDQLEAELRDLQRTALEVARARAATIGPIRVLFVCTGNSARSQMAEALLRQVGADAFAVSSAGTEPRPVHPMTVEVLGELGIDWGAARSRSLAEVDTDSTDYLVTVCDRARLSCPPLPGVREALHWGIDDPAEVRGSRDEQRQAFRRARDELAARIGPFTELAKRARAHAAARTA
jgi:arsenate reductase